MGKSENYCFYTFKCTKVILDGKKNLPEELVLKKNNLQIVTLKMIVITLALFENTHLKQKKNMIRTNLLHI